MTGIDAFVLARMQFAANISFHILFPTITLALAVGVRVLARQGALVNG